MAGGLAYGLSSRTLRFGLLRYSQSRTFKRADGLVFLTQYARDVVSSVVGHVPERQLSSLTGSALVSFAYHGRRRCCRSFTDNMPCRVLYVSIVDMYKHQWHVAEAVARLRSTGLPVVLELVGPRADGIHRLEQVLNRVDPDRRFVFYRGGVPYEELHRLYSQVDINVFASSCENMPNILLEGMAAGVPTACSRRGPMPEVLRDAGVYFDPENPNEIATAIRTLMESPGLRAAKATAAAHGPALAYSWQRCADETVGFLAKIASHYRNAM